MTLRLPWLLALSALLIACTPQPVEPVTGCQAVANVEPLCGFQAPEDMVLRPGEGGLLISQMGVDSAPGSLVMLDLATLRQRRLYPSALSRHQRLSGWGAEKCPGPPGEEISPHGIDLHQRQDGAWQLWVVNHGGRESVESFELTKQSGQWELIWRGCVPFHSRRYLNDVAALPGGGMLATEMFRTPVLWSMLLHYLGGSTGRVWEWQPDVRGLRPLPGSGGSFPNGILTDPEGKVVYVNYYLDGEVRRFDRGRPSTEIKVSLPFPDNSSWSGDGELLVAAHVDGIPSVMGCENIREGACPAAFSIYALDPETLEPRLRFHHPGGAPMGAGTVALEAGPHWYMGSLSGDRLVRIRRQHLQP